MSRETPLRSMSGFEVQDARMAERERVMAILQLEHDVVLKKSEMIQRGLEHGDYPELLAKRKQREMDTCLDKAELIRDLMRKVNP